MTYWNGLGALAVALFLGLMLGYAIKRASEPIGPERVYMACDAVVLPTEQIEYGVNYTNFLAECDIYNPEEIEHEYE